MGYFPDQELIDALNDHGLWHGTTVTLPGATLDIDWSSFSRWDSSWLEALDGLYITSNHEKAVRYARLLAGSINMHQGTEVVRPVVYQVDLETSVELALDEDELGWAGFVGTWNPLFIRPRSALVPCFEYAGVSDDIYKEIAHELREEYAIIQAQKAEQLAMGDALESIDVFLEDADLPWFKDLLEKWSLEWTAPALEGWLLMTKADPAGAKFALPDLRILSGNFELIEI